jgi:2,5-diamino-6-(ribosylamino)-4(3H)-pyrimidinone 5'-phosphate reductase
MRGRPYVICHMAPSVDGRIVTDGWRLPPGFQTEYERTASSFDADAWIIDRISMEPYAGTAALPASSARVRIPRTDFVTRSDAPSYAIAIDPGKEELVELITHLAFYSGWPTASSALTIARRVLDDRKA